LFVGPSIAYTVLSFSASGYAEKRCKSTANFLNNKAGVSFSALFVINNRITK